METSLVQIVTLNRHHLRKQPFDAVHHSDLDLELELDLDLDPNRNRTHIAIIASMALKSTIKTTSRTPSNPPLGVLASREEWRKQLESLPDKDQLGRIPSIFCEPSRTILRFLSPKVGGVIL